MIRRILLASLALSLFAPLPALSADKLLGTFQDWQAYVSVGGKRLCYIASAPQKKEPAGAKRGDVLVYVAHRPADNERDVVNFQLGYPLKPNTDVRVVIDKQPYTLFTDKDNNAWTRSPGDDKKMVQDMIKASTMVVTGESERGTKTTDTYSLRGFSAAYGEINKACSGK